MTLYSVLESLPQIFEYQGIKLCFSVYGQGKKILLAFHGYGQSKEHFSSWSKPLGDHFTIYSFDLFFHGESHWPYKDQPLSKEMWGELIKEFLQQNSIIRFSLAGFSLGAKFLLALVEIFPSQIDQIILIAPDGIKTNFWYDLATYPLWLKKYFKTLVFKPKSFFLLIRFLQSLNLMDKGILKFSQNQMNNLSKRRRVYYSWVVFKELRFDIIQLGNLINQHGIQTIFFLGKYDKIIPLKRIRTFLTKVSDYQLEMLETGHQSLISDVGIYYEKMGK